MRSFIITLSVIFFTAISSYSQDAPVIHREGSKALSFSFNGFALSTFNGGVGGKYWVSDNSAVSASITFSANSNTSDQYGTTLTTKELTAGIFAQYELHFRPSSILTPYLGIRASYSVSNTQDDHTDTTGYTFTTTAKVINGSFGPVFGIEYFITNNISFAGQQMLNVTYSKTEDSYTHPEEWTVGFGASSLILSIYF